MPLAPDAPVEIGAVLRAHGLTGEIRARLFNPQSEALSRGKTIGIRPPDGTLRQEKVTASRVTPDGWLVRLEGVTSRNEAEALRGATPFLRRDALPAPAEGEFYAVDLVGCAVFGPDGARVGTVSSVAHYPTVDALVIARDGASEAEPVECPMVEACLLSVDLAAAKVVVDLSVLEDA